jgi:hypothetical protein
MKSKIDYKATVNLSTGREKKNRESKEKISGLT